ncbi:MAG: GDP-L-fucose synthase, partial [Actinomycetes bacterium]
ADACLFLLDHFDEPGPINVGAGKDLPILELAELIRDVVHPSATIHLDASKPDGMPRKLLDTSRLESLGWTASIPLRAGIEQTYRWFVDHTSGH